MDYAGPPDAELVACLQAGNLRAAGTLLVRRHAHEVMSLCRAMVRDLEVAEDLTQEVFGRAFVGLQRFRQEASSRTWILTIARNRCIDYLRAEQRDPEAGGRVQDSDPDHHADDSPLPSDLVAQRRQLKRALDGLGEIERALVVLRYRHGLDHRELAEVFGLREGTARMRLNRAIARMRAILEQPAPAEETPAAERRPPPVRGAIRQPAREERPGLDLEALEQEAPGVDALEEVPAQRAGSFGRRPPPGGSQPQRVEPPPSRRPPPRPLIPGQPAVEPSRPATRRPSFEQVTPRPDDQATPRPGQTLRQPAATPPPPAAPRLSPGPLAEPAPTSPLGQALGRLDPGLPYSLLDRLMEEISRL